MKRHNPAIGRELWSLSYPTMISYTMQSVYDMVDMLWLGRISSEAVAGVTIFSSIFFLFTFLNEVIGSGSISVISQNIGRGDEERARIAAEQTITFKVVMGILTALILGLLLDPLLHLFTKEEAVLDAAYAYGGLRILFLPVFFASFSANTIFRCSGDAKTPMKILLLATITNLVLDPILMFDTIPGTHLSGLGLGVYGAALATVLSISLSFVLGFFLLFRRKDALKPHWRGLFTLHPSVDLELIRVGLPNGIQMVLRYGFNAILVRAVAIFGVAAVAAFGIGGKIYGLAFLPIEGMLMGGSVLLGRFLGKEDIDSALDTSYYARLFNGLLMTAFTVLCYLFGADFYRLFTTDAAVISMGQDFLFLATPMLPLLGLAFGMGIAFLGSGYQRPMLIGGFCAQWLIQLPIILWGIWSGHDIRVLFISYLFADFFESMILWYFFRRGTWKWVRVG